ncbi:hypothetical protein TIFTF001_000687 [Ficus carica]|uniref:Transmembrane protein n=1 Tax=Ficus carica TaxID=3494 RepID=A0AA87ZHP3_FICCA|nr:hypothetical protein TIFTF001_000687 [Ficus carica]
MTPKTVYYLILLFSSLTSFLSTIARAQGRAPHGLANENPTAFSPSAYEFFHPTEQKPTTPGPCSTGSSCSPLPLAAHVEAADKAQGSSMVSSHSGRQGLGAGGVAGIVFGIAFAVLLAMGAYYVVVTRRQNLSRAVTVQPGA